jgi:hypothetical protein
MSELSHKFLGLSVALLVSVAALTAVAGPGDGAVVIIDRPDAPDLIIQELRSENSDATHVPVKVRVVVPATSTEAGKELSWAKLTAYLTSTTSADDPQLAHTTLDIGPEWVNRSLVVEVPSPGEGTYFMHVEGTFHFDDQTSERFLSTSTQRVSFGKTLNCKDVQTVPLTGAGNKPCPILFETGGTVLLPANKSKLRARNQQVIDATVKQIDELCAQGALHRVSVRGWASTKNSFDPPNEVLARGRADTVLETLRARVAGCAAQIHDDSEPGTRSVTNRFDEQSTDPNQCAQIQISRHTCVK